MIEGLVNSGALPALERVLQFAGARHRIITNNIANLSTPGFRPVDVPVEEFQAALREAVDDRRAARSGSNRLRLEDTSHITFKADGMEFRPEPKGDNLLFHDGTDHDLERTMQDLVENFMVFRQAAELLRNRMELMDTAIRERV